jgi:hypothetical protein
MASGLYLLMLITLFTGIGRLSTPARERTDLRTWTPRDVWRNARRGVIVLGEHGPSYPLLHSPACQLEREADTDTHGSLP